MSRLHVLVLLVALICRFVVTKYMKPYLLNSVMSLFFFSKIFFSRNGNDFQRGGTQTWDDKETLGHCFNYPLTNEKVEEVKIRLATGSVRDEIKVSLVLWVRAKIWSLG